MAKYRIGISENLLGDKRYQCQIKRFGIWWNDESFSTKERMLDYARKLVVICFQISIFEPLETTEYMLQTNYQLVTHIFRN